ncbi:MAG: mRNA surveillance protein pelota, partial [Candidatus Methanomethylophilaceae archaeon]
GFEKELLADSVKQKDAALSSNAYVYHTGQSGMQGINELMKKGIGTDVLRKSRVGIEMEAVENLMEEIGKDGLATYGTVEVGNAAAAGAVRTLLILDSKLRDGDYDRMVRDTESQKGNVVVVSEQHDAGKELGALGGFAALLRYKIP